MMSWRRPYDVLETTMWKKQDFTENLAIVKLRRDLTNIHRFYSIQVVWGNINTRVEKIKITPDKRTIEKKNETFFIPFLKMGLYNDSRILINGQFKV